MTKFVHVGSSNETKPTAEKNYAPVKPTKSNPNTGAVVQRNFKMDVVNAG